MPAIRPALAKNALLKNAGMITNQAYLPARADASAWRFGGVVALRGPLAAVAQAVTLAPQVDLPQK